MADSIFEVMFVLAVLLVLVILLRRVRQLERAARAVEQTVTSSPRVHPLAETASDMFLSPLTVVLGQIELARASGALDHRLEIIERQALRLMDLAKRGRVPMDAAHRLRRELDPALCARAVIDQNAGRALARGVTVHSMLEETSRVRTNPFLLSHALRHLVQAAVEAAPAGEGDVTVAVGEMDGRVLFAVADDGPGLTPGQISSILDPSTEQEHIGYSVVYALAGGLDAEFVLDTAPDAGTRATLKLPVVAASAEAPEERAPVAASV